MTSKTTNEQLDELRTNVEVLNIEILINGYSDNFELGMSLAYEKY